VTRRPRPRAAPRRAQADDGAPVAHSVGDGGCSATATSRRRQRGWDASPMRPRIRPYTPVTHTPDCSRPSINQSPHELRRWHDGQPPGRLDQWRRGPARPANRRRRRLPQRGTDLRPRGRALRVQPARSTPASARSPPTRPAGPVRARPRRGPRATGATVGSSSSDATPAPRSRTSRSPATSKTAASTRSAPCATPGSIVLQGAVLVPARNCAAASATARSQSTSGWSAAAAACRQCCWRSAFSSIRTTRACASLAPRGRRVVLRRLRSSLHDHCMRSARSNQRSRSGSGRAATSAWCWKLSLSRRQDTGNRRATHA
jgi:hypothetical protein